MVLSSSTATRKIHIEKKVSCSLLHLLPPWYFSMTSEKTSDSRPQSRGMGRDEKTSPSPVVDSDVDVAAAESQTYNTKPVNKWLSKVSTWGVELRGITPVPLEERVDKRFINVFFVWFAMSTNLLP